MHKHIVKKGQEKITGVTKFITTVKLTSVTAAPVCYGNVDGQPQSVH